MRARAQGSPAGRTPRTEVWKFGGAALRPLQNGLVQFYALGMVLGLAVFLTVVVFRNPR